MSDRDRVRRTPRVAGTRKRREGPVAGRPRSRRAAAGERSRAGRLVVPSAITILALCAALTAMRFGEAGEAHPAMLLLAAAAVLDGLDGRVARMMDATSRMGAELDSLADAVNFGVAPAVMVYTLMFRDETDLDKNVGWMPVLVYCSAIILRLARFNTLLDDDDAPAYTKDFFVGVPAPAAAVTVLLPIGLAEQFGDGPWTSPVFVGCWLVFVALLAVSRVPTFSFKSAKLRPRMVAPALILVATAAALLFTFPYALMVVLVLGYLAHIPFAWRMQRWISSRPEYWDYAPHARRRQRRDDRRAAVAAGTRRRVIPVRKSSARLRLRRPERRDQPGD
ncbi:MAG: phosphatidylcholine/phosphatidylserine synthase [Gordonia sp. (in: high G+C Gram-positive bacteria)]|uniref:CDP-alcohol phosphatidyltransferase family protein n=1 Tax=Gordonia sp. (in: high G+C Gram-positive bacteria) TaxID=84139 RepID=UPI0039E524E4